MAGTPKPDYKNLTDEQLILAFQKDDVDAFNEIVKRYKNRIVNFIFKYTNNREDAEDFAQETFLKLYLSKNMYKEIAKFSTWLYTIAFNIVRTYNRSMKKNLKVYLDEPAKEGSFSLELQAGISTPDEIVNSSDENEFIHKTLNSMDEKYKDILILRDIQDLEYEEIAIITGLPLGTVKTRIIRGRKIIKVALEKKFKSKQI